MPAGSPTPASGGVAHPFPASQPASGGGAVRPGGGVGSTVFAGSAEPEIAAAEAALRNAEIRAREAQIEVSRRVSEIQEARMGVDLARTEVELRRLKTAARTSDEKSRIKALESRVSVLRSLIKEDLPGLRDLQSRMLKAQMEDPASVGPIQADLAARQRVIARKQVELEIATLKASKADPARLQALERRLEDLKRQAPGSPPAKPAQGAKSKGKS